jgi:hypothetical protein
MNGGKDMSTYYTIVLLVSGLFRTENGGLSQIMVDFRHV